MSSTMFTKNLNMNKSKYVHKPHPPTSYGILALKISDRELFEKVKTYLSNIKYLPISSIKSFTNTNGNEFNEFSKYKENIKFLMIMRKHTLGYTEFVRGNYNLNNVTYINYLFKQMMPEEVEKIAENDFDFIWHDVWGKANATKSLIYTDSNFKYNQLVTGQFLNGKITLSDIIHAAQPTSECPEWGIPKGRRCGSETNIDCARREFYEETGYNCKDYILFDNIVPFYENFVGTNGIKYRHVYYLALLTSSEQPFYNKSTEFTSYEIGAIDFFDIDTAYSIVREYFTDRRRYIFSVFANIINALIE